MRARVFVTLKPSVFDPQGKTVTDALHTLGYLAATAAAGIVVYRYLGLAFLRFPTPTLPDAPP